MKLVEIESPPGFPLFGWTFDSVKEYFMDNPLITGDSVIIYNSHAGFNQYFLAKVLVVDHGRQKQIILSRSGLSGGPKFFKTGKNVYARTGQSRMLPLIPEISKHLSFENDVILKPKVYS